MRLVQEQRAVGATEEKAEMSLGRMAADATVQLVVASLMASVTDLVSLASLLVHQPSAAAKLDACSRERLQQQLRRQLELSLVLELVILVRSVPVVVVSSHVVVLVVSSFHV